MELLRGLVKEITHLQITTIALLREHFLCDHDQDLASSLVDHDVLSFQVVDWWESFA